MLLPGFAKIRVPFVVGAQHIFLLIFGLLQEIVEISIKNT
jgi:hypothetical protein